MSKFRKKPVVIEAVQWFPDKEVEQRARDTQQEQRDALGLIYVESEYGMIASIDTLEGRALNVSPGDWIITGIKSERYPCKPDIFAATYEPVEP